MALPDPTREWLLTDARGGFAMGSTTGCPSRRYHGWLIGATTPPVGRVLALKCFAERYHAGDTSRANPIDLTRFRFESNPKSPGPTDTPDALRSFEHRSAARWEFDVGEGRLLSRSLAIVPAERLPEGAMGAVRIEYQVVHSSAHGATDRLELRPLVGLRPFHDLETPGSIHAAGPVRADAVGDGVRFVRSGLALWLCPRGRAVNWHGDAARWEGLWYALDAARGQDAVDGLAAPGVLRWAVPPAGGTLAIDAVLMHAADAQDPPAALPGVERLDEDRERVVAGRVGAFLMPRVQPSDPDPESDRPLPSGRDREPITALVRAAEAFVVQRSDADGTPSGESVIAGYPWFADWGRDTMIALPGLLTALGRLDEARRVLTTFASHRRRGLIPNRFDDRTGTALYNTVDASLWFVHACDRYGLSRYERGESAERYDRDLFTACAEILGVYRDGTDYAIGMDPEDGLIAQGGPETQLTWMDAQRNGITFTPREGKPVEINALWIHALRTLVDRAPQIAETIDARGLAERAERSFRERFVRPNGALADRLAPGPGGGWTRVDEIRPNQLFAASLEFGPLDQTLRRAVVAECREHLLTPVGLRTLSPTDPAYLGRFEGDMMARDAAYHQGTVWPWLLGPFCEAHLRAEGFDAASKADVRAWLMPLLQSLSPDAAAPFTAIGQLSEVYDGDHPKGQPRRPGGCPAQAWSVAEVLRVLRLVW